MSSHHEQPQTNPESSMLRDESTLVREKLKKLIDTNEPFTTNVDGLFLVRPGQEYSGTHFIDKGCRGGWTEHYTTTLGTEPSEVKRIYNGHNRVGFSLAGGGKLALSSHEIDTARFLVSSNDWSFEMPSGSVDQKIHELLSSSPYGLFTSEMATAMTDWEHRIYVKPRFPLDHPISYRPLRSDYLTKQVALDGSFSHIETYLDLDTNTTYAQVTVDEDSNSNATVTDWVPLEHLAFYEQEQYKGAAFEAHIGHLARALTEGETDTTDINDLLSRYDSFYQIHRETSLGGHTERVIAGRHEQDTIRNIGAVVVRKSSMFYGLNIPAHHVVMAHDQPWVVDESGIAVPLKHPDNFTLKKYLSTSDTSTIGQLIEQAPAD